MSQAGSWSVVSNPAAGRGRGVRVEASLLGHLRGAGIEAPCARTRAPGEARALAASAAGAGHSLLVVGGDGTVNEVVNGLADAAPAGATLGPLVVVPAGTGNDFAAMSGAPGTPEEAVGALLGGARRAVDLGRATARSEGVPATRRFANTLGAGFEAEVNRSVAEVGWCGGTLRYVVAAITALGRLRSTELVLELDEPGDGPPTHKATLLSIGNTSRCGGGFRLTPDAVCDDGRLDLLVVGDVGRVQLLGLLPRALRGSHAPHPAVTLARFRSLRASFASSAPLTVDGEPWLAAASTLEVEVEPQRLALVTPA